MNCRLSMLAAAIALACGTASARQPDFSIQLNSLASYTGSAAGIPDTTGIEVLAFDRASKRVFAINAGANSVDVVDLANPANPTRVSVIDFAPFGGGVNGVAVHDGLVAVAVEAFTKTDPGSVVFLDAATLDVLGQVPTGALPDMVTFTPDGEYLLVANEGEPSEDYSVDPEGSVTVIDLRAGVAAATARTAGFSAYVGQEAALRAKGIRIFGLQRLVKPDGTVERVPSNAAQDFEPEYIAVQGPRAYVTLQENNAVAVLNIGQARIESVLPLGFKDHSIDANKFDASDRDGPDATGRINIANWPVYGMFQPDAIATLRVRNEVFLLTANEGDARVYPTGNGIVPGFNEGGIFNEEVRVGSSSFALDTSVFPGALLPTSDPANPKNAANLGRLNVTNTLGAREVDGDAQFERIYAYGARSFSVWDPSRMAAAAPLTAPNPGLVWDSADQFEQITASVYPGFFNASNNDTSLDSRSDNKGPEPEGVTVGRVGPRDYAFIGLERIGTLMVYDVTNPRTPQFVQYLNTRSFGNDRLPGQADSGAEGVTFVSAEDSPNGRPLLLVGNEVSQTMAVFEVEQIRTRPGRK
jgi:2',3'-cyclic-nucleotide 2'-phosphodiesterase / 3'-nucleotidase / 5'-nucleotidase